MNRILHLIFLCFVSLNCYSQALNLLKGQKEKTFKEGSLFEIVSDKTSNPDDKRWCSSSQLIGKITSIHQDSLTLQLSSYTNKSTVENIKIEDILLSQTGTIEATIAQNDIIYLSNFKYFYTQNNQTINENFTHRNNRIHRSTFIACIVGKQT